MAGRANNWQMKEKVHFVIVVIIIIVCTISRSFNCREITAAQRPMMIGHSDQSCRSFILHEERDAQAAMIKLLHFAAFNLLLTENSIMILTMQNSITCASF